MSFFRKLPANSLEKLQQDKFSLEERLRDLESQLREERGRGGPKHDSTEVTK